MAPGAQKTRVADFPLNGLVQVIASKANGDRLSPLQKLPTRGRAVAVHIMAPDQTRPKVHRTKDVGIGQAGGESITSGVRIGLAAVFPPESNSVLGAHALTPDPEVILAGHIPDVQPAELTAEQALDSAYPGTEKLSKAQRCQGLIPADEALDLLVRPRITQLAVFESERLDPINKSQQQGIQTDLHRGVHVVGDFGAERSPRLDGRAVETQAEHLDVLRVFQKVS